MPVRVLPEVREQIARLVYEKADAHRYLEKSRVENGMFMNNLVNDPNVGGRLLEYMAGDRVKTYIKDSILNRYSKDRRELPRNVNKMVWPDTNEDVHEIEYNSKDNVSLHRTANGEYTVIARVNPLKWETGLRRLLLFTAACPGLQGASVRVQLVLLIFEAGSAINGAEKELIQNALGRVNVLCIWG